ncbi:MAG: glycosyltransferase, partial [Bacilli bacterium]
PLFQRPQHIARELSKQNCLVLYATYKDDKILTYKYVYDNLFLINFENKQFNKLLNKFISNSSIPKYIQLYSTDWFKSVLDIKKFISSGYKILYEYIDDLHPALTGTKDLAKNIVDKYKFCSENTNDVIVVTTADKLYNDVYMVRKDKNLIFSGNGVEYEHFIDIKNENDINKKMIDIIKLKKPIIGYYGALAKWFDYDLIKYIAFKKPEYEIVLIGLKYDTSFDLSKIEKISNVHYLGVIDYIDLPKYIKKMDIMTIPFLINDITKATSPCKLFEYMSASKPIVTTDLNECRKYKSVMIGKTKEEFVLLLDKAFDIIKKNDKKYFTLLKNEALANTWKAKAELIIKGLEKSEKTR